jgi:hypothetical protein
VIRLEHALAAGALACVAVAVAVPTRFDIVDIAFGSRPGSVVVDDTEVLVHAPVGWFHSGSQQRGEEQVFLRLESTGGSRDPIFVSFQRGDGPAPTRMVGRRDGRPINLVTDTRRTAGVAWKPVDDAVVIVSSRPAHLEHLVEIVENLEVLG